MSDFDKYLTGIGKSRDTATDLDEIQWLRSERQRLRLTDEEREALEYFWAFCDENVVPEIWIQHGASLRGLAERTK